MTSRAPAAATHERNPALRSIFAALKGVLAPYAKTMTLARDDVRRYELWTGKPALVEGRTRDSVFFAGLIIQKDYVGFYFMPVYAEPEIKNLFPAELLKLLKGKACFHIRSAESRLMAQVRDALKKGYDLYVQRGWI